MSLATDEHTARTRHVTATLWVLSAMLSALPFQVSAQSEFACPELELGHPCHTLDSFSFLLAVREAPEAFRNVPSSYEPRPLLRPGCPGVPRMEGHAVPDILPVLASRRRALAEHGVDPANLEIVSACLAVNMAMVPPPPATDPGHARHMALARAWGRMCNLPEQWMTVSLPRRSETDEDQWSVWVRATNGAGLDVIRIDLRWEGEGHEPEVVAVEWEWGVIS